jgi:hypothetical protein
MGMIKTATRLLTKFGQVGSIVRQGDPIPDGQGGTDPGSEMSYPVTLVVAKYEQEAKALQRGLVEVDLLRVLVSIEGLAITPKINDRMVIGGERFRVVTADPLTPSGEVIFWELGVTDAAA